MMVEWCRSYRGFVIYHCQIDEGAGHAGEKDKMEVRKEIRKALAVFKARGRKRKRDKIEAWHSCSFILA